MNVRITLPLETTGLDMKKYNSTKNEIGGIISKAKIEITQKN